MRLVVLGSGSAGHGGGRRHSCYWVEGEGVGPFTVDFGATALYALRQEGFDPNALRGIAFTHLHGDHMGGFPYLVIQAAYEGGRTAPMEVWGPRGTEARLRELLRVTYGSLAEKQLGFALNYTEVEPGEATEWLGVRLVAFAAEHLDPPEQALCVRVEGADGVVAFSGDTRPCAGLFAAAAGADWLVAECTGLAPPSGRHCTWSEWQADLGRLGETRLLLTHLGDEVRAEAEAIAAHAPERLRVAEDGLRLGIRQEGPAKG